MPRRVKLNGKQTLAGIVGDFMVEKQFQVFGPALQLIKTVIKDYPKLGFQFLYTFPNQASEKVALRAGFQKIGLVSRFVKPLKTKHQLTKYIHPTLANLVAPGFELGLKLLSKETYIRAKGTFSEINQLNPDYNLFWKEIENQWSTLGERGSEYLKWRYFKNPLYRFHMFTHNEPLNGSILGYIIFTVLNNNADIFDILVGKEENLQEILAKFLKISRKTGYHTVSIRVFQNNPFFQDIKSFGFFDRKEEVPLLFAGDPALVPREWVFFDGDRNI